MIIGRRIMAASDPQWSFDDFFSRYPAEVSIVTAQTAAGAPTGCTCTGVMALSPNPPSLLVSFMNTSNTLGHVRESGSFGVNAMGVGGEGIVRRMASKARDKFDGVDWHSPDGCDSGVVFSSGVVGYAHCLVDDVVVIGDHSLVVGHIDQIWAGDVTCPLLYAGRKMWFPTALPASLAS